MRRIAAATVAATALLLSACTPGPPEVPAPASPASSASEEAADGVSAAARTLLAGYGLVGESTVEVIDALDRLGLDDRPSDLMASVRVDELLLTSADGTEHALDIPADRFYLSVAPYVDGTHECFYHSLTTCKGELSGVEVEVEVVTADGEVLVEGTRATFENGFIGFWLPRNVEGTLRVTYGGKTAQTPFATDADAPTCLTTLRLV